MSKVLFFALFFAMFSSSCSQKERKNIDEASRSINSISVIIDDQLWNGEVGDSIRNKFASPVVGLPQEEPSFTINQYPVKLLEGYMSNSRNILVIKREPVSRFKIVRNESPIPQNIVYISGRTVMEINAVLHKNASPIFNLFHDSEIEYTKKAIDTSLMDDSILRSSFNISMHVPSVYKYVLQKEKFVWLKREFVSGNTSILVYQVPMNCLEKNLNVVDNIVKMRDSIGALYIHGTSEQSVMTTEEAYAPYLSLITLHNRKTYVTKGTWEIKSDFMTGPFMNYALLDKKNNRIIVLEGFAYAPSKEKRDMMHDLEAIIESVNLK